MSIFGFRKSQMVSPERALPGRSTPMPVPERHEVLGTPLKPPYPEGSEVAEFALGCFWGEERTFWQVPALVAHRGGDHARYLPERLLLTPEAAERELGYLAALRVRRRQRRAEHGVPLRNGHWRVPPGQRVLRADHLRLPEPENAHDTLL